MIGMDILKPAIVLMAWTMVMWAWMYGTRIPAMMRLKVDSDALARDPEVTLDRVLPPQVQWKAQNYNHLHEQPTIFYALCIYSHLTGVTDGLNVGLAWAYVGLRVIHSLIQITTNFVPLRFVIFNVGSLILAIIAVRNVLGMFGY